MKNNKQQKKDLYSFTKIILSFYAVISLISCSDFLEVEPLQSVSDELAITDKASLNTAIRGAYRHLSSDGYYGQSYVYLGYVQSGDVKYQVFNSPSEFEFRAEDGLYASAWSAIYRTINITNHVIAKTPEIIDNGLTQAERNTILGEAHFIRALAYFDLARAWGGVPIKTQPTTDIDEDANLTRSTLEQTYDFVLSELIEAENLLSENVNRIRATKYTVWALRARYHLYRGEWERAVDYSTRVINSPNFKLLYPYNSWFADGIVQSEESILELVYSSINPNPIFAVAGLTPKGGAYRYRPEDATVDILTNSETGGGRRALLDSVTQSGETLYAVGLYYRKPATDPSYVLRIAEQYLIRAEANAQIGLAENLSDAIDDLNAIRNRADLANTLATTKEEILDAILAERRLEFLWEAHRYFDLTRTGKLKEEIEKLKPVTIQDHQYLLPIPLGEVMNGGLEQNPGY
jgi:hypothetical protein